jgi:hypothetical protein
MRRKINSFWEFFHLGFHIVQLGLIDGNTSDRPITSRIVLKKALGRPFEKRHPITIRSNLLIDTLENDIKLFTELRIRIV